MVTRAGEDYYSVLGVDKGADKKSIKSAYRQKVPVASTAATLACSQFQLAAGIAAAAPARSAAL